MCVYYITHNNVYLVSNCCTLKHKTWFSLWSGSTKLMHLLLLFQISLKFFLSSSYYMVCTYCRVCSQVNAWLIWIMGYIFPHPVFIAVSTLVLSFTFPPDCIVAWTIYFWCWLESRHILLFWALRGCYVFVRIPSCSPPWVSLELKFATWDFPWVSKK